jgi:alpha-glucosidase (family GH31 glycosyl hydrolase)
MEFPLFYLFVGSSLLVKPITEQGGTGTTVYFPGNNDVSINISMVTMM